VAGTLATCRRPFSSARAAPSAPRLALTTTRTDMRSSSERRFVPGTEPWLTFTRDPLDNGWSFYSFRNPEGDILECGIGDDYAEALVELHTHLSHA
jgi:hypothetical protein